MPTLPQNVSGLLRNISFKKFPLMLWRFHVLLHSLSYTDNVNWMLFTYSSSVGSTFARNRAVIFAMIGLLFIAVGVGVTVSATLDYGKMYYYIFWFINICFFQGCNHGNRLTQWRFVDMKFFINWWWNEHFKWVVVMSLCAKSNKTIYFYFHCRYLCRMGW